MKKTKWYIAVIILVVAAIYSYYKYNDTSTVAETSADEQVIDENIFIPISEIPFTKTADEIIKHKEYALSYNEECEQANWVAYVLTKDNLVKNFKRKNDFRIDSLVETGTAISKDYKKSGYDRGHLLPAADMTYDKEALSETFYYSNISPQKPYFNRGIWLKMEKEVRKVCEKYDTVWVVTGPVLDGNFETIGEDEVAIPKYFYKVLLIRDNNKIEGVGFLIENKKSKQSIFNYCVPIDSVEKVSNIDFFHSLPDNIEKEVEARFDLEYWK